MQRLTDFGAIQPCYKFAYSVFVKANKSPTTAYLLAPCPVSPQQGLLNSKKPRFARGVGLTIQVEEIAVAKIFSACWAVEG